MADPAFGLASKSALIAGATPGIGLAIAREYGAAGARLLAAPGGGFTAGENIVVDGGTTIGDGN
ncbi:hypothetical protein GCM10011348_03730 [Marinobacterium nitratireducens]|uniref:Short chain dehydrogenase n=1 Tax=Marinobacterium nitratireducens TaxID=518897 RepID=A0A917Z7B6_9GAMM|nr:hypothetical protein [Marinobacterium nitratireducens]GGO76462.1 hypothetical protein GCM10011348_03730 [Marinobacterium nitratireducens]